MPLVKMLKTTKGSDNGFIVTEFMEGQEYNINDSLAKTFIDIQVAEYVKKVVRRKSIVEAPENKAIETAPNNKEVKERIVVEESMRVFTLADELNTDSKTIIKTFKKLFNNKITATNILNEIQIKKIKEELSDKNPDKE